MPLTGEDNLRIQAFNKASKMLAQSLASEFPLQSQTLKQFSHVVRIDDRTDVELYPSDADHLPLGLTITSYDASGSMENATFVGLFTDWSFVYGVIKSIFETQGIKSIFASRLVLEHDEVKVGDLIVDLGFTVTRVDTDPGGERTWLYDGSGARILLVSGHECSVSRNWPGHDEFVAECNLANC